MRKKQFTKQAYILLLMLFFCGYSFAQINLSVKQQTIKQIIPQIEKASGYNVFYTNEIPGLNEKKDLTLTNASINDALDKLFQGTNISYQIKADKQIILSHKSARGNENNQIPAGNKRQVKGVIVDENNEPLIGVSIRVKDANIGTATDVDGSYSIDVPENSTLVCSYVGYLVQQVPVGNKSEIKVVLKEDTKTLDEVVVVGYGTQRKSDLTGGLAVVGKEKLEMVSTNNLLDRLAGQVPGLNITTSDATPGKDQNLRIRGENSISAENDPLIVLDGIPYNGSLGDIDPDNIENMTILKDASAAAIYGSRGANGVILIQFKKGKKGTTQVTYKGQFGLAETMQRIDVMKGEEYVRFKQEIQRQKYGWTGDQLDPENILSASELVNYRQGIENDWQDYVFRTAFTMNHQVGVSGGTDNTTYMASVSYLDQEGVVFNSNLKRANVTLNITQVLNKWLTIGVGSQFVEKETGGITPNLEHAIKQSPYGIYKDENGNYYTEPMDQSLIRNPMVNVNADDDNTDRNFFLNGFADILLPVKGLSFRSNFGYNYRTNFRGTYYGRDTYEGSIADGKASISNTHYWDYTWENVLKYNRDFGKHRIDATGLFSVQETQRKVNSQSGTSFVNDDSSYHKMAAAEKNKTISSSLTETALMSYMLRLNYTFDKRYMLTLTGRSDGYSAFGENNKYAFFPSIAGAWNVSEEGFMQETKDWMDMLKLRVSYGSNGNQAVTPYQTLDRLYLHPTNSAYIWGDQGTVTNGAYLANDGVGNPNLKWETSRTLNVGLDFSFFNGRLSGNIETYEVNTKDLLMKRTVPIMNGYKTIWDNVGQTRNRGIEVNLNSLNINTKDFKWESNYNFSLNRDKIVDLRGDKVDDITNRWFIGKPLRVYYDYKVVGIWQEGDQFTYTDKDGNEKEIQKGAKPGSAKLEDKDNNGYIDSNDKKIIGSKMPSFRMSLGNTFTYKDFRFSFLLNGVFKVTREFNEANIGSWSYNIYNYLHDADYWTPENPNSEYTSPAYTTFDQHSFYKDLTYVQIKNITLGYRINREFLRKVGISALDLNLSVNNVYTFSNIRSVLNYDNSWMASYPTARSYVLGVNLTF